MALRSFPSPLAGARYWYEDDCGLTVFQHIPTGHFYVWEGEPIRRVGEPILAAGTMVTPEEALEACVAPSIIVEAS